MFPSVSVRQGGQYEDQHISTYAHKNEMEMKKLMIAGRSGIYFSVALKFKLVHYAANTLDLNFALHRILVF